MDTKWIIGGLLAIALGVVGFATVDSYTDEYNDKPGVVYNNDGDGHDHDHGYFGVETK